MKKLILITLLFCSCSNLSKNFVRQGQLEMRAGKVNDQQWEDDLVFKRYSWYRELTLVYDVLIYKVDQNSPWYNWFSKAEREAMAECKESFVVLSYTWDEDKINKKEMIGQFKTLGYSRFALREYGRNIRMHPDYEALRLQLYKVDGICRESFQKRPLVLSLPGFKSKELTL